MLVYSFCLNHDSQDERKRTSNCKAAWCSRLQGMPGTKVQGSCTEDDTSDGIRRLFCCGAERSDGIAMPCEAGLQSGKRSAVAITIKPGMTAALKQAMGKEARTHKAKNHEVMN